MQSDLEIEYLKSTKEIPEFLLNSRAEDLFEEFGDSKIFHLEGQKKSPILISVLLHGNEQTGFYALVKLLQELKSKSLKLQYSIYILLGNLEATKHDLRKMPKGHDFNRIWNLNDQSKTSFFVQSFFKKMKEEKIIAAIDLHNNTGLNPPYSCFYKLDSKTLAIAKIFSDKAIHITKPKGAHAIVFSDIAPSVTLECGLSEDPKNIDLAYNFLCECLGAPGFLSRKKCPEGLKIFENKARIIIPDGKTISFHADSNNDFEFYNDIEELNFTLLVNDVEIGKRKGQNELKVICRDDNDVTRKYIYYKNDKIFLKKGVIPSMFTRKVQNIIDDCLCYLMSVS